ncbi:MAG: response regulator [Candidatus Pacebacteria bacterium]|nr:response regulator [Candidatus Paceibacterota bacterium]
MKVLFIEDDPIQIMVMGSKFKLEGIDYVSAGNCKESLAVAIEESPDIILLDILLGGENGLDVLEKIKSNQKIKDIPVIVFTNYAEKSSMEKAKKIGAVDFIIKSGVTPKKMVEIVKGYFEKKDKE